FFFCLLTPPPPISTLFPYTTLFRSHDVVHEVLAERAARVREPRGEAWGLRVEEDAGRLERRGAQEDDARAELERLVGLGVDDADPRGAFAPLVVQHALDHAVGTQREPAGGARRRERHADAVEVRVRDAAALARPAVVARRAPAVRRREDRDAPDRHDPLRAEALRDALAHHLLGAVERHRREELAV